MKRALTVALTALIAGACTYDLNQSQVQPGHPILGTWEIAAAPSCTETETFRANGTRYVTSNQEVAESAYTISPTPDARGVYTLVDTITKDNGKPDCNGGTVPVGDVATLYVRFSPSGDQMITCYEAKMTGCFLANRVPDL